MSNTLCTAVMVTGKTRHHESMARIAVQCFQLQTWKNKELVIVNDGPYTLGYQDPNIREIKLNRQKSLGDLRNIGLENAQGGWVIQWDDDDWHSYHRMKYQMGKREEGKCQLLLHQLRVNIFNGLAYRYTTASGIAGTILHPAGKARYPGISKGEDAQFWLDNWGEEHRTLLDNRPTSWPGPGVYIRLYHGRNTWDFEHIMRKQDTEADIPPQYRVTAYQRYQVNTILKRYSE